MFCNTYLFDRNKPSLNALQYKNVTNQLYYQINGGPRRSKI